MSEIDQLVFTLKQAARDEIGRVKLVFYGYVSSYDDSTNSVRVRIPELRSPSSGDFVTPPIPLASWMAGNSGAQYYPDTGTPCQVSVVSLEGGSSIVSCMLYNDNYPPPFAGLLNPNDFGWMHSVGSYELYTQDGNVKHVAYSNYTLLVGAGSFINLGGDAPVNYAVLGNVYREAEDVWFTALAAQIASIGTEFGLIGTAFTSLLSPPQSTTWAGVASEVIGNLGAAMTSLAASLALITTQLAAFQAPESTYLSAIVKVE